MESRKDFLRRFGFKSSDDNKEDDEVEVVKLTDEQTTFLKEYSEWLEEFHSYVKKRNKDPFNVENNKRLMELSQEAEQRKPILEKFMEDAVFKTVYNDITEKVSADI